MLINLIRNAAEAVLESGQGEANNGSKAESPIVLSWTTRADDLVITIEDAGAGLMNPSNAFVPFYTTKRTGSGIGLVLSRQIAEAHGGSLELENRTNRRGCIVRVRLPLRLKAESR